MNGAFYNVAYSQNSLYPLSFKANQVNNNGACGSYYRIQKVNNKYGLLDTKNRDVFNILFDTIVKNAYFIKTVKGDSINIYRCATLEKIAIPEVRQVYFKRDGLEVLSTKGAQYYDNSISKIDNFPLLEFLNCGNVYSKNYRLEFNKNTNTHTLNIKEGDFGMQLYQTILELKGLPENIESLRFLNDSNYVSESINSSYNEYPQLIKIVKNNKSGIYTYNLEDAVFPKKIRKPQKKYTNQINKITGDTIVVPIPEIIEPISLDKLGTINIKELLPIEYNQIQQNTNTGLVYLYKNIQIGIFPEHPETTFDSFNQKTTSFYEITKNEQKGWLDIRTFTEYYFE